MPSFESIRLYYNSCEISIDFPQKTHYNDGIKIKYPSRVP